jgi:predicted phosphoribosyltransferase
MFNDRKDAAVQLGEALKKYRGHQPIVLGIPRGGAETAFYVATCLESDFSLLISRKLGHPGNPEFAIGAIAEDGTLHLNENTMADLSKETIEDAVDQQKKEIERRIRILRNGQPLPVLKNRLVILVDDGIATGATMIAAIKMCRNAGAAKVVVAAPVAGSEMKRELRVHADDVVILETPVFYHAVSQAYQSFHNLTDKEARHFLELWEKTGHKGEQDKMYFIG